MTLLGLEEAEETGGKPEYSRSFQHRKLGIRIAGYRLTASPMPRNRPLPYRKVLSGRRLSAMQRVIFSVAKVRVERPNE